MGASQREKLRQVVSLPHSPHWPWVCSHNEVGFDQDDEMMMMMVMMTGHGYVPTMRFGVSRMIMTNKKHRKTKIL